MASLARNRALPSAQSTRMSDAATQARLSCQQSELEETVPQCRVVQCRFAVAEEDNSIPDSNADDLPGQNRCEPTSRECRLQLAASQLGSSDVSQMPDGKAEHPTEHPVRQNPQLIRHRCITQETNSIPVATSQAIHFQGDAVCRAVTSAARTSTRLEESRSQVLTLY